MNGNYRRNLSISGSVWALTLLLSVFTARIAEGQDSLRLANALQRAERYYDAMGPRPQPVAKWIGDDRNSNVTDVEQAFVGPELQQSGIVPARWIEQRLLPAVEARTRGRVAHSANLTEGSGSSKKTALLGEIPRSRLHRASYSVPLTL